MSRAARLSAAISDGGQFAANISNGVVKMVAELGLAVGQLQFVIQLTG
ncbi:hypothetical protein [Burkholderia pseudomallei]|nr:hypothetical protein [Burkholderia pseudomallei]